MRFLPAGKPEPWTGVKDALEYGHRCPQPPEHLVPEWGAMNMETMPGADCLVLNIWTNGLKDGHKRPVMVFLHGGGFVNGHGNFTCYDGTNLAAKHDVVVITLNHRLNLFGFLYLADVGGEPVRQREQRRHAGHRAGARMGARQHRQFRRRSRAT